MASYTSTNLAIYLSILSLPRVSFSYFLNLLEFDCCDRIRANYVLVADFPRLHVFSLRAYCIYFTKQ